MNCLLVIVALLPFVIGHSHDVYKPTYQCKQVNGGFGEWSSFGPCSKTCGTGGIQKRHRYCDSPIPKYRGKPCVGDSIEVKPCDGYTECPVDGGWGDWTKGYCSKKCGGGEVTYKRHCNNPQPKHCGSPCEGPNTRNEPCNTHHCPIPGGWTELECGQCFTDKSTKKCVKKCSRTCTNPKPKHGGADCEGKSHGIKPCNPNECQEIPTPTKTPHPDHGPCYECLLKAKKYANHYGKPEFVGHACRVDNSHCHGRKNGIRDMYTAKHWFFLHCSPDGPWCKPCATRGLVYNPKCGQCETTRDGYCTGPMMWRNQQGGKDDELELIDDLEKDEDIW